MNNTVSVLADLFIMFTGARIAGEVFQRLRQSPVIGELLVGVALGTAGIVGHSAFNDSLAEIGAIVLLFYVGLETRASSIFAVGRMALAVALLGIALPFALGYGFMLLVGANNVEALFVGTALTATSVGITARVLSDMGYLQTRMARVILGAAIIDDVLAMLALAIVGGLGSGTLSVATIAIMVAEAIAFTVFVVLLGTRVVRQYGSILDTLHLRNAPFVVAILISLGLSLLASYIGLAAIIGAFLAGMMFAETADRFALARKTEPLYDFLVPFFFVITGTRVDVGSFLSPGTLVLALGVTALAVVGKLVACTVGAWSLGRLPALIVGVGMVPRGEVGIVVALLGLQSGAISAQIYGVVVFMALVTTFVVPPALSALFARQSAARPASTGQEQEVEDARQQRRAG